MRQRHESLRQPGRERLRTGADAAVMNKRTLARQQQVERRIVDLGAPAGSVCGSWSDRT